MHLPFFPWMQSVCCQFGRRRPRRTDGVGTRYLGIMSGDEAPASHHANKRELDNASTISLAQALEIEALAQSVDIQTDDMREALMAYMERRPPTFQGR